MVQTILWVFGSRPQPLRKKTNFRDAAAATRTRLLTDQSKILTLRHQLGDFESSYHIKMNTYPQFDLNTFIIIKIFWKNKVFMSFLGKKFSKAAFWFFTHRCELSVNYPRNNNVNKFTDQSKILTLQHQLGYFKSGKSYNK